MNALIGDSLPIKIAQAADNISCGAYGGAAHDGNDGGDRQTDNTHDQSGSRHACGLTGRFELLHCESAQDDGDDTRRDSDKTNAGDEHENKRDNAKNQGRNSHNKSLHS
jgi:hypothetical protein